MIGIKFIIGLVLLMFVQISFASDQLLLEVKCTKGDMYSCQKLGKLYHRLKEDKKANQYFSLVCDNNISDGCMSLATYYDLNKRKYAKKAFEYYLKSCDLNNSYACNNLGNFYRQGKVVDLNYTKAISFFEKSYCLNPRDKPFKNRTDILQSGKFSEQLKYEVDCVLLQIDESMDTANLLDDESIYQ